MAKSNDNIAPFDRRETQRWTRLADYWPEPRLSPRPLSDFPIVRRTEPPTRGSRRGFFVPIAAVLLTALLSLWASGVLDRSPAPKAATATSQGLVFGLCNDGGLTNCVASGDSFYLGGKTVRIAGIDAPQIYGAACPKEEELGRRSAARLRSLLNSGELEFSRLPQDLDAYGLLLRNVSVNGKDVGRTMAAQGLAREIGDISTSWC